LDLKRVGLLGHSTAGALSLQPCGGFERCAGAIDLDGSVFASVVASGTIKPVLFIMGEAYRPPDLPGLRLRKRTSVLRPPAKTMIPTAS
jgi:hypothetical protein